MGTGRCVKCEDRQIASSYERISLVNTTTYHLVDHRPVGHSVNRAILLQIRLPSPNENAHQVPSRRIVLVGCDSCGRLAHALLQNGFRDAAYSISGLDERFRGPWGMIRRVNLHTYEKKPLPKKGILANHLRCLYAHSDATNRGAPGIDMKLTTLNRLCPVMGRGVSGSARKGEMNGMREGRQIEDRWRR